MLQTCHTGKHRPEWFHTLWDSRWPHMRGLLLFIRMYKANPVGKQA